MQIICGINAEFTVKRGQKEVTRNAPVENVTLTQHVDLDDVVRLLDSCDNLEEFKQRSFHVVSRRLKKEGIVVFPKEFRGFDDLWNNSNSLPEPLEYTEVEEIHV